MLEFDGVGAWLPGQGVVLDEVSVAPQPGEIWAVVGRSGAGSSTLLRAADDRLPHGALVRGRIRRRGGILHIGDLPPVKVSEFLGALASGPGFDVARFGALDHLGHRTTTVPPDVRAGLLLAALEQAPRHDVVLVDAVLTAAPARIRHEFGAALSRRAADGATVCWADHDLSTLLAHSTHVLELGHGQVLAACPVDDWLPATLPDPRTTTDAAPHRTAAPGGVSSTIVEPGVLGLTGKSIELPAGICVGIVRRGARPEPIARLLVEHLGGDVVSSHARPRRPLPLTNRALWLPHAQAGLDALQRQELISSLTGETPGIRILTGRDEGFLQAVCQEIVVIEDDEVVAQGAPPAIAALMPEGGTA